MADVALTAFAAVVWAMVLLVMADDDDDGWR